MSVAPIAYPIKAAVATGLFSRSKLYELIASGVITAHKSAGRTVILAEELDRFKRSLPTLPVKTRAPARDQGAVT
jgi:hypothetical protein